MFYNNKFKDIYKNILSKKELKDILTILSSGFEDILQSKEIIFSIINKEPFKIINFSFDKNNKNDLILYEDSPDNSIIFSLDKFLSILDISKYNPKSENFLYPEDWRVRLWKNQGYKTIVIFKLINQNEVFGAIFLLFDVDNVIVKSLLDNIKQIDDFILLITPVLMIQSILLQNNANNNEKELIIEFSKELQQISNTSELIQLINLKLCSFFNFYKNSIILFYDQIKHALIYNNNLEDNFISIEGVLDNFWELETYKNIYSDFYYQSNLLNKNQDLRIILEKKKIFNFLIVRLSTNDTILGLLILGFDGKKILCNRENRVLKAITHQISYKLSNLLNKEYLEKKELEKTILLNLTEQASKAYSYYNLNEILFNSLKNTMKLDCNLVIIKTNKLLNTNTILVDTLTNDLLNSNFTLNNEIIDFLEKLSKNLHLSPLILNNNELILSEKITLNVDYFYNRKLILYKSEIDNKLIFFLFLISDNNKLNLEFINLIKEQIFSVLKNIIYLENINKLNNSLIAQNKYLVEHFEINKTSNNFIGNTKEIKNIFHKISLIAKNNTNVLILGETGTGKELVANEIHKQSNYSNKLMVKLNCASIPHNLLESELFGHEKGAFTGAYERRIGKFELANDSTLFLDEIGELPLDLQAKLLRVIQEKEFERIGSHKTITVNTRIIAATNRNLEEEVKNGRFRSDLFYRLNVFPIILPPLRERKEDLPELVKYFINKFNKKYSKNIVIVSEKVIKEIENYDWPGNIRELEFTIERAVILSNYEILNNLNINYSNNINETNTNNFELIPYDEHEKKYFKFILDKCNGKIRGKNSASEILKIPPTTLYYKLVKLGLK